MTNNDYKCPHCNKTVAIKHKRGSNLVVNITKEKPPDKNHNLHLVISRRCDRHMCRQIFWVEVYAEI